MLASCPSPLPACLPACMPPAERHVFSLHNLCLHGRRCGVVPGRWLGPWVMCRALQAAATAAQQQQQGADMGLAVEVLGDNGGGAPLLVAGRFEAAFAPASAGGSGAAGEEQEHGQQQVQGGRAAQQNGGRQAPAAAAATAPAELVPLDSGTLAVEVPPPAAALAASTAQLAGVGCSGRGLVLLVPLVLGLGKVRRCCSCSVDRSGWLGGGAGADADAAGMSELQATQTSACGQMR
jgi:cysteine protease ATG4